MGPKCNGAALREKNAHHKRKIIELWGFPQPCTPISALGIR